MDETKPKTLDKNWIIYLFTKFITYFSAKMLYAAFMDDHPSFLFLQQHYEVC